WTRLSRALVSLSDRPNISSRSSLLSRRTTSVSPITSPSSVVRRLFNAAHLFTPNGRVFRQKKVHLTPTEKTLYQLSRGHGFYVYHTEYGRIAILVCYDVEFPEAARALAEAGAEILVVPSS